jgi:hypothetical protein
MSLLGILFAIVMFTLIGKAIIETIWGLCLIACGILLLAYSKIYGLLVKGMRIFIKPPRNTQSHYGKNAILLVNAMRRN